VGCVFAYCLISNLQAQPTLPGGGNGGGGGGGGGSSFSSMPANTNFLISLQSSNIVLNWRSATNKIFLLESRATLDSSPTWGELTNYYLSTANTNWTRFVHTNVVRTQSAAFYRLFDVTPVAKPDFFAVDQDSSANQLDILENDICPNDDAIIITNLVAAQHGSISYTADASTFQYTPDSGFYGVDTFAYNITSKHGEISSNAIVTVFVNQSGNNPPSVPDIIITLQTNVHTATFNALTNATDPDSDTVTLFAVNVPSLGSVSNDASGNITYTRNPSLFGGDAFTYIVTDGKGGYGLGNVKISQVDSDGDGMPDEWEMANGLDPFNDDSMDDPDNDGLPNLAEYVLGTNPHVADNPLNLSGVSNGTVVSGFAQLPIWGIKPRVPNPSIMLYANSNPVPSSILSKGADGGLTLVWDSTHIPNGDYQIMAGFSFAKPGASDNVQTVLGEPKSVTVNNLMTFDTLTSKFTTALFIDATLTVTNASYDIYLYDVSGTPLVYATGLTTTNGQIHLYWNLTDGQGNQIAFNSILAKFIVTPQSAAQGLVRPMSASSPVVVTQWFVNQLGLGSGLFSVAYGYDSPLFYDKTYREQMMLDGIIDILASPYDFSSYLLLPSANVPYASAFRYDNDDDKKTLLNACQASTLFFWNGHGYETLIGGNLDHSYITSSEMSSNLMNNQSTWSSGRKTWIPKPDQHPYKLVILNACHTYSQDWCKAFGVDFDPNGSVTSTALAGLVGRNKQAFVGWPINIQPAAYDPTGLIYAQYSTGLSILTSEWMAGYPLYQCMQDFGDYMSTALGFTGFSGQNQWKISGCFDLRRGD